MATLSDYVAVEHLPGFTSTDMSSDKGVYFQQVAEHPQVGRDTFDEKWLQQCTAKQTRKLKTFGKGKRLFIQANVWGNVYIGHVRFDYDSFLYVKVIHLKTHIQSLEGRGDSTMKSVVSTK